MFPPQFVHNPGLTYKKVESVFKYTTGEGFDNGKPESCLAMNQSKDS